MRGRKKGGTYTPFGGFAFVYVEIETVEFWPCVGRVPEVGIDGESEYCRNC